MKYPKGRLPELDPASRAPRYAAPLAEPTTKLWTYYGPILHQKIGCCTGFSAIHFLNSEYAQSILFGRQRKWFTAQQGLTLYGYATRRDAWPGEYPPTDTGSSGLAVCKALMKDFLVDGKPVATGYNWSFGAAGVSRRMPKSPVLIGIPWPKQMDEPDSSGYLRYDPTSKPIETGHQIFVNGYNAESNYFTMIQTWGPGWGGVGRERGRPGRARIEYDLMDYLLHQQGDAVIPTLRLMP